MEKHGKQQTFEEWVAEVLAEARLPRTPEEIAADERFLRKMGSAGYDPFAPDEDIDDG